MLPFKKTPKKRMYQCFICGVQFDDYEEFKSHIVEHHEKGREYVSCPLCDAPVRDCRLHAKVKHPGQALPPNCQMRATIWYDFSGGKRKRQKKMSDFKEGYHVSPKNDFQPMHYRSGYELETYKILDEHVDVVAWEVEPNDCIANYFWDGGFHKYHPDLKVIFTDGRIEVWEIKPGSQTGPDYQQNQSKWDACAALVGGRGWTFKIKTEQGIERLKQEIKRQKNQ